MKFFVVLSIVLLINQLYLINKVESVCTTTETCTFCFSATDANLLASAGDYEGTTVPSTTESGPICVGTCGVSQDGYIQTAGTSWAELSIGEDSLGSCTGGAHSVFLLLPTSTDVFTVGTLNLNIRGTFAFASTGIIEIGSGGLNVDGGTFIVDDTGSILRSATAGVATVSLNSGTFNYESGAFLEDLTINVAASQTFNIIDTSGGINLDNVNAIANGAGATIAVSSSITSGTLTSSTFSATNGGSITVAGKGTLSSGLSLTVDASSSMTITSPSSTLIQTIAGSISNAGTVTLRGSNSGELELTGSFSGSGTLQVFDELHLNLNTGSFTFPTGTLQVGESADIASLSLTSGATLDINDDGNSIGSFSPTSDVTFCSTCTLKIDVNSRASFDILSVTGSLTFTSGANVVVDSTNWANDNGSPHTITIATATTGITGTPSVSFVGGGECSEFVSIAVVSNELQLTCGDPCVENSDCDDSNDCTTDGSCVVGQGCPSKTLLTGTSCTTASGTDACSIQVCDNGVCIVDSVNVLSCDDNNPCTIDPVCNPSTGCTPIANRDPFDCDDGIFCTEDLCDENLILGTPCYSRPWTDNRDCTSDSDVCTSQICSDGVCSTRNICGCSVDADCDDNNPCSIDTCVNSECEYSGVACPDDENSCTVTGVCGARPGAPDQFVCTYPFDVNKDECDDGDPCTEGETCDSTLKDCVGTEVESFTCSALFENLNIPFGARIPVVAGTIGFFAIAGLTTVGVIQKRRADAAAGDDEESLVEPNKKTNKKPAAAPVKEGESKALEAAAARRKAKQAKQKTNKIKIQEPTDEEKKAKNPQWKVKKSFLRAQGLLEEEDDADDADESADNEAGAAAAAGNEAEKSAEASPKSSPKAGESAASFLRRKSEDDGKGPAGKTGTKRPKSKSPGRGDSKPGTPRKISAGGAGAKKAGGTGRKLSTGGPNKKKKSPGRPKKKSDA